MVKIDDIDKKILEILQEDSKITNTQLAKEIDLSPSSTLERVRRLESSSIIKNYSVVLDKKKIGIKYTFILNIKLRLPNRENIENFIELIQDISEISEAYKTLGTTNFILKVNCRSIEDLDKIISEKISDIEEITDITTNLILSEIKENNSLAIKKSYQHIHEFENLK